MHTVNEYTQDEVYEKKKDGYHVMLLHPFSFDGVEYEAKKTFLIMSNSPSPGDSLDVVDEFASGYKKITIPSETINHILHLSDLDECDILELMIEVIVTEKNEEGDGWCKPTFYTPLHFTEDCKAFIDYKPDHPKYSVKNMAVPSSSYLIDKWRCPEATSSKRLMESSTKGVKSPVDLDTMKFAEDVISLAGYIADCKWMLSNNQVGSDEWDEFDSETQKMQVMLKEVISKRVDCDAGTRTAKKVNVASKEVLTPVALATIKFGEEITSIANRIANCEATLLDCQEGSGEWNDLYFEAQEMKDKLKAVSSRGVDYVPESRTIKRIESLVESGAVSAVSLNGKTIINIDKNRISSQ